MADPESNVLAELDGSGRNGRGPRGMAYLSCLAESRPLDVLDELEDGKGPRAPNQLYQPHCSASPSNPNRDFQN